MWILHKFHINQTAQRKNVLIYQLDIPLERQFSTICQFQIKINSAINQLNCQWGGVLWDEWQTATSNEFSWFLEFTNQIISNSVNIQVSNPFRLYSVFRFCFNQSKWIEKGSKNKMKTCDCVSTCSFMVIIVAIMYPALDAWRVAKLTQIINCRTKYSFRANTKTFITFLLSIDLIWEKCVMPNVPDCNSRVEYLDP